MLYFTIIGGVFIAWLILVVFFTPAIPYYVEEPIDPCSEHFVLMLESTCNTKLQLDNKVEIFTNGTAFYPAMLSAIRTATETVNVECYIFKKGDIADQFIEALAERARAGVKVTIVLDAIGSFGVLRGVAPRLRDAGCRVERYQALRWYSLARLNNRTHREILVVDSRVAFVGGAGIADWWAGPHAGKPMWRDMMARIEGPVVANIQGVASENWLECCGEILTSVPHLPSASRRRQEPGICHQELAGGSGDGLPRAVSDAGRVVDAAGADLPRRISCRTRPSAARSSAPRGAASRSS